MSSTVAIKCVDHKGNEFDTQYEMCTYWEISAPTYLNRIKLGLSQEEALTKKTNREPIYDHKEIEYKSFSAMCIAYKISNDTVKERLKRGWSLKDSLTEPLDIHSISNCTDHTGKIYTSISNMCSHYSISRTLYNYRIKVGWTQEEALTTPIYTKRR